MIVRMMLPEAQLGSIEMRESRPIQTALMPNMANTALHKIQCGNAQLAKFCKLGILAREVVETIVDDMAKSKTIDQGCKPRSFFLRIDELCRQKTI